MCHAKVGLALCFLLIAQPLDASAATLTIMAEDAAPPFSQADGTGYANEIVKAAFRAAGVDVALDVVPYARCKKDVEEGRIASCFSMSWYKGVERVVTFSRRPILQVYADIFLNRTSAGRIRGVTDIGKGTTVGVVNEYEYPASIEELRRGGATFQSAPNDGSNLKMLARGRLDVAIVMTNDLVPTTQKAVDAGAIFDVIYAFRGGVEDSYIGFSRKHPEGERARQEFDLGYERILADGTAAAIRRKWTTKPPQ